MSLRVLLSGRGGAYGGPTGGSLVVPGSEDASPPRVTLLIPDGSWHLPTEPNAAAFPDIPEVCVCLCVAVSVSVHVYV